MSAQTGRCLGPWDMTPPLPCSLETCLSLDTIIRNMWPARLPTLAINSDACPPCIWDSARTALGGLEKWYQKKKKKFESPREISHTM